jgi:hypothetical protein
LQATIPFRNGIETHTFHIFNLINKLCGCDLQNAGASLFRVPELTLATALNTKFSVLKKIAESISPDLTTLQKSSKAHCVPGQVV